jgi:MinD superfamily P-loop ATPase
MGDQRVESWCEEEKIEILAKIPNDRKVAEAYSRGEVLVDQFPHYDALLSRLFESVVARINSRTQIEQQGGGQ